jgi:trans-aconitate methyltransferase
MRASRSAGSRCATCPLGLAPARPFDAVVSTTALHWLSAAELGELYRVLATLLRPGGCVGAARPAGCGSCVHRSR